MTEASKPVPARELPPLPEHSGQIGRSVDKSRFFDWPFENAYTADRMREYALAALSQQVAAEPVKHKGAALKGLAAIAYLANAVADDSLSNAIKDEIRMVVEEVDELSQCAAPPAQAPVQHLQSQIEQLQAALRAVNAVAIERGDKYGVCDAIDNAGAPYQSQWLADLLKESVQPVQQEAQDLMKQKAAAFDEWIEKTNWVQEKINTFHVKSLGKHRADVMRDEIEYLRAKDKP